MNFVVLGALGKMGKLLTDLSRQRGHNVRPVDLDHNPTGLALTREGLQGTDVVIDFTTPHAVLENISVCVQAGASMVVGTTGWYGEIPRVRHMVEQCGVGFLYAANFSIGVNLFFDVVRAAAPAFRYGYSAQIVERHHTQKKDAPSGTAVKIQKALSEAAEVEVPISSVREGDTVGMHVLLLDSENDTIMLTHDAKSRRGFAEGAVRAAEWLAGKRGFYDFKDIFRELG